jgi:hypothetical protein
MRACPIIAHTINRAFGSPDHARSGHNIRAADFARMSGAGTDTDDGPSIVLALTVGQLFFRM